MKDRHLVIGRKSGKGEMSFGWFPLDSRNPWPRARMCLPKGHALIAVYREVPPPNSVAVMISDMVHAVPGTDEPVNDSYIILQQRASPPHPEFNIAGLPDPRHDRAPAEGHSHKAARIRLQGPAEWGVGTNFGEDDMSFKLMLLDRHNPWPEARRNISEGFVLKAIYRQVPHGSERTLQTSLQ